MKTKFDFLIRQNKIRAGIFAILLVTLILAAILFFHKNSIEQIRDTYIHEAGNELLLKVSDFFYVSEEKASQIIFDISAVDGNTVGEYVATAYYKDTPYEIKVSVVDTTAPKVELEKRYLFTNDIQNTSLEQIIQTVSEHSNWSTHFIRFEKQEELKKLDEAALTELTDKIPLPCDATELSAMGTEELPAEEGIYRAVLEVSDSFGNKTLEELYIIYDTTGARIEDAPDKTLYVESSALESEPEISKNDYTIIDNVDGTIAEEDIHTKLELLDADKHEWLVHVSYTDRAGNKSTANFWMRN